MATTITVTSHHSKADTQASHSPLTGHKQPLKLSGALDRYKSFDVTPIIGREYPEVNLKEWLEAENSEELLRDLAITSKSEPSIQATVDSRCA